MKQMLMKKDLYSNPFKQFELWFKEAEGILEANAMTLATATKEGQPSCRTVLLKDFSEEGFVFFTNYESRKSKEIEENPLACVTFLWKEINRQVCIEGRVERCSQEASAAYFSSRKRGSQISATASRQGTVVASREVLDSEYERIDTLYKNQSIPLPPYWGGYLIRPNRFEFWQGREHRLHDRFQYMLRKGEWEIERLAP